MGGPRGWFRSWRWVLGASPETTASSCGIPDRFLPFAQLQVGHYRRDPCGVQTPFVSRNMTSFLLVSGLCSPRGESILKIFLVQEGDSDSGSQCGGMEQHPGFTWTCSGTTGRPAPSQVSQGALLDGLDHYGIPVEC